MTGLTIQVDGGVLRLTLDRAGRHNALDSALRGALIRAFGEVGEARAVVIRGAGPSFSAGADIGEMRAGIDQGYEENLDDAAGWQALLEAVDSCPAPVVAGVQGVALGGAVGVLACCDVVVAARHARLGFGEVKLGIVPAVISPFVVRRIGSAAARRLFVTGERVDAETALRIGLVTDVVDDLDSAVERVVEEILGAGPRAVRVAKRLARAPLEPGETARLIAEARTSVEGQEGLRAFLERRPPTWLDERVD